MPNQRCLLSPGMGFLQKINSSSLRLMSYRSSLSDDQVAALRRWHERAYQELIVPGERRLSYLGLDLIVPPGVFPPTPMSDYSVTRSSKRWTPRTECSTWALVLG